MERPMNAAFVKRHLKCGKSRLRPNRRYPHAAWFGAPGSSKFVRCYPKPTIGGFRIELQLNRELLAKHKIQSADDFVRLPPIVARQIVFFRMDWHRLATHLKRSSRLADTLLRRARALNRNLTELLRFLRQVSVANPERFLARLPLNDKISEALRRWKRRWKKKKSSALSRKTTVGED
jgi:hypothetical protein